MAERVPLQEEIQPGCTPGTVGLPKTECMQRSANDPARRAIAALDDCPYPRSKMAAASLHLQLMLTTRNSPVRLRVVTAIWPAAVLTRTSTWSAPREMPRSVT